jgi:hypothetical protein
MNFIRRCAMQIFGVPDHRRCIHEERDREIWRSKKLHPELTWGQFSLKFGLSRGAAELAFKRAAKKEKRRLCHLHWLIVFVTPHLGIQNTRQEVTPNPPF